MSAALQTAIAADPRYAPGAPWMLTASGHAVNLLDPDPGAITLFDIAAHLSKLNRFCGATTAFFSVAQHSVLVSRLLIGTPPRTQLHGLLHDAHEAFMGDIPSPVKCALRDLAQQDGGPFDRVETIAARLDAAIYWALEIAPPSLEEHRAVSQADARALATERRDLLPDGGPEWFHLAEPARGAEKPWPWPKAEEKFLARFDDLALLCGLPSSRERPR